MANNRLDMLQIKQLLLLYSKGESKLSISNRLGLSRNTVRKYISLFHSYQLTFKDLSDLSVEEVEDLPVEVLSLLQPALKIADMAIKIGRSVDRGMFL